MTSQREQGLRILEDVAELLEVRDLLTREREEHEQTKTALKVQRDRADHYAVENTTLAARNDHLQTQVAQYRAELDALAKAFESEGMTLARWVADQAVFLRERATAAEMAPYLNGGQQRPLQQLQRTN